MHQLNMVEIQNELDVKFFSDKLWLYCLDLGEKNFTGWNMKMWGVGLTFTQLKNYSGFYRLFTLLRISLASFENSIISLLKSIFHSSRM